MEYGSTQYVCGLYFRNMTRSDLLVLKTAWMTRHQVVDEEALLIQWIASVTNHSQCE